MVLEDTPVVLEEGLEVTDMDTAPQRVVSYYMGLVSSGEWSFGALWWLKAIWTLTFCELLKIKCVSMCRHVHVCY